MTSGSQLPDDSFEKFGWTKIARGVVIIAVLVLLGYFVKDIDFESRFRALPFSSDPDAVWYRGPAGFVIFGAIAVSIGCPRQVASFFAAYFFGLWTGFIVALAAVSIACLITFSTARIFRSSVQRFVRGKLDIAVTFWRENTFLSTMIWRFMPAGSNLLTNLAAGA
ncbi:MAG: VTT domain-containing protein, partial [Pseudomonadota bacterium]